MKNKRSPSHLDIMGDIITEFVEREKRVGKKLDLLELEVEKLHDVTIELDTLVRQLIEAKKKSDTGNETDGNYL